MSVAHLSHTLTCGFVRKAIGPRRQRVMVEVEVDSCSAVDPAMVARMIQEEVCFDDEVGIAGGGDFVCRSVRAQVLVPA